MKTKLSEEELLKLSPEELYEEMEYLAEVTIYRMFDNADRFAQSIGMEKEDLLQLARIGLFTGCKSFHTKDHGRTLKNHLIVNIRWHVSCHIDRLTVGHRIYKSRKPTEDNLATVISMSNSPQYDTENTNTFYDLVSTDNINKFDSEQDYPENIVVTQSNIERMLSVLTEKERELVLLRIRDEQLTFREIGEIKGVTRQGIHNKFYRIQEKIRAYLDKEAIAY